jgi:hypothetical protein
MAFKVNYNQQRNDRNRAKQAKKDAKLREKEAEVVRRRNARDDPDAPEASDNPEASDATEAPGQEIKPDATA